jgi:hypothetical protein
MSVVGGATRRRWLLVAVGAAVLLALPAAVAALPARVPTISADTLAARIAASASQSYSGYAVSHGSVNLPSLPALSDVTGLFTGDTSLRIWYGSARRWRVDTVTTAGERDVYQTINGQTIWDSGQNLFTTILGDAPVRLPRGSDLAPPDLARRLLAAANQTRAGGGAPATRGTLPARRIAGVAAAGLRLTPTDPHTTVGRIDIWADPRTGLPLEVDVTPRGAATPVLTSRLLDVRIGPVPDSATEVPTVPVDAGIGEATTTNPDVLNALSNLGLGPLPDHLAGLARTNTGLGGLIGIGAYGTGLSQILAASIPGRTGFSAFRAARNFGGVETEVGAGDFVLVSTPLLNVVVVRGIAFFGQYGMPYTYLVAGLADPARLTAAATELTSFTVVDQ